MVQTFCLFLLLHCLDKEWAIRLLVGTYVDEGLYEHALDELQNLPDTPENAVFIALYQAIIQGGIEGSGKSDAASSIVNVIAGNSLSKFSTLAQSVLAVYNGVDYTRHGAPIKLPNKSLIREPAFKLIPNPAQDHINISFTKPLNSNQTLEIYNLQGQLALTQKVISQNSLVNISMLQSGMYFCRISDETDIVKLVILR